MDQQQKNISQSSGRFHYSWIVAGITFLTLLVGAGIRSTPGVLMVPLEQEFGWDRATISFAIAVNIMLYGLIGPFAASLMERYGVRRIMSCALILLAAGILLTSQMESSWQLTLLWGVAVGLGTGCIATVLGAVVANRWFVKHRGLVIGVLTASGATGQLIFLPLLAQLSVSYGWRSAAWVTAAAALLLLPIVLIFMRDHPEQAGVQPYGAAKEENDGKASSAVTKGNPFVTTFRGLAVGIRSFDFWLLAGSFFICGLSTNGLIGSHFIPASIHHGIPEVKAAGMLAFIGIFDIIGTTVSGWLSDRLNNRWLLFWYYGLRGLSLLILPYALQSSQIGLMIFIVFYGLDWVATVPPTVRITTDIFGKEQAGILFGWIAASHQIGAGLATYGGGVLFTWLNSYVHTFIIAGLFCFLASLMVIRIRGAKKYRELEAKAV